VANGFEIGTIVNASALFIATFLACLVEAVEATTIVLAVGTARSWRSAIRGTLVALVVLAAVVAVAGPAITLLPIAVLRVVVGTLLLVFGLGWIRKAVLRASGRKALHDEAAIYDRTVRAAGAAGTPSSRRRDPYAFTLSFKGVLLEGLEVVFIVLTFGTNAAALPLATLAAVAAIAVVVVLGFAVRGPLSRVPENTLKFVVGIMLTAFGTFWSAEGAGAVWPGADAALLVLAPAVAVVSLVLVAVLRRRRPAAPTPAPQPAPVERVPVGASGAVAETAATPAPAAGSVAPAPQPAARPRLVAIRAFWLDFLFGDDWLVPVILVIGVALTALVAAGSALAWCVMPLAVLVALPWSVARALR
jgi:uncharacterized membrane protein